MIEIPDPAHDGASSASEPAESVAEPEEPEPPAPERVSKPSLKDRVRCEACNREVSRYCLEHTHKCKAKKISDPPPEPKRVPEPKRLRANRPSISKAVIKKAVYWQELHQQDEPESPDFHLGSHLHQLHLYNRDLAARKASGPYSALFAH